MNTKIKISLNYDNFEHSIILVEKNNIISWKATGLSKELSEKYGYLQGTIQHSPQHSPSLNGQQETQLKRNCDTSNDGKISFTECYKCISDAISENGLSSWICDFPVIGWLSCWVSTSAACAVISIIY